MPKKTEGVLIWGPADGAGNLTSPEDGKIGPLNRAGSLDMAISPIKAAQNHHIAWAVNNNKLHAQYVNGEKADTSWMDAVKDTERLPLFNIRKKRFDYSNFNKFFGHAMKTMGAWLAHKSLEESYESYHEEYKDWLDAEGKRPGQARAARLEKYTTEMGRQHENIGHDEFLQGAMRFAEVSTPGSANWGTHHMGPMTDVFSEAIWAKNSYLKNEFEGYQAGGGGRFLSVIRQPNQSGGFDTDWLDRHADDLGSDYISLSISNQAWNWQNFMLPNEKGEKPTMPNYSLAEKAFDGFWYTKLCMFGASLAIDLWQSMRSASTSDGRGSGSVLGMTTTNGFIKRANPLVANRLGQGSIKSFVKTEFQEHSIWYAGFKDGWGALATNAEKLGKFFGFGKSGFTAEAKNDLGEDSVVIDVISNTGALSEMTGCKVGDVVEFRVPTRTQSGLSKVGGKDLPLLHADKRSKRFRCVGEQRREGR